MIHHGWAAPGARPVHTSVKQETFPMKQWWCSEILRIFPRACVCHSPGTVALTHSARRIGCQLSVFLPPSLAWSLTRQPQDSPLPDLLTWCGAGPRLGGRLVGAGAANCQERVAEYEAAARRRPKALRAHPRAGTPPSPMLRPRPTNAPASLLRLRRWRRGSCRLGLPVSCQHPRPGRPGQPLEL